MYTDKNSVFIAFGDLFSCLHIKKLFSSLIVLRSVIKQDILVASKYAFYSFRGQNSLDLSGYRQIYILFKGSVDADRSAVLAAVSRIYYHDRTAFGITQNLLFGVWFYQPCGEIRQQKRNENKYQASHR